MGAQSVPVGPHRGAESVRHPTDCVCLDGEWCELQIDHYKEMAAMVQQTLWYVIRCLACDEDGGFAAPIPFESPEARGKWASEHTKGTGHDRWLVTDEPRIVGRTHLDGQVVESEGE